MIYVLGPKDKKIDILTINTTTSSKTWSRNLSPMLLGPTYVLNKGNGIRSWNVENAWQFTKVYKQHVDVNNNPTNEYWEWANKGFSDRFAHRYPMGKGATPEYSLWDGTKLDYIEARKQIYVPLYKHAVIKSGAYDMLESEYYKNNKTIALWDFDGYDYLKLGMTLEQVLDNPDRKMGHAFVLAMMLESRI